MALHGSQQLILTRAGIERNLRIEGVDVEPVTMSGSARGARGDTSAPLQVYFWGMSDPSLNALLESRMFSGALL